MFSLFLERGDIIHLFVSFLGGVMLLDAALLAGRKLSLLTPPNWQSESKRLDTKETTCFYITSKDQKIVFISLVKIILCSESQLPIFHMS